MLHFGKNWKRSELREFNRNEIEMLRRENQQDLVGKEVKKSRMPALCLAQMVVSSTKKRNSQGTVYSWNKNDWI